jgi:hypothetical protein
MKNIYYKMVDVKRVDVKEEMLFIFLRKNLIFKKTCIEINTGSD